ncbi:hypothetical protein ACU4HD_21365 [Cupriavidus basilensis]
MGIGVNYTWFTDETISNQTFVEVRVRPESHDVGQRQELVETRSSISAPTMP